MKLLRIAAISAAAAVLSACGGHGFEGKWQVESDNPLVVAAMKQSGASNFNIGDDYLEANGQRNQLDDIFVRESEGKSYLVFVNDEDEQAMEIIDDNTLQQSMGPLSITFVRQ